MKEVIKKVIKKVKKTLPPKVSNISLKETCPTCLGSGLWRPTYVNSPQCETCTGHGFIN